jgi:hypothetical protein
METPATSRTAWRGPAAALGLLLFRLHLGVVMVEAGLPKLETSDWFTQQVAGLGFTYPSPALWAGLPWVRKTAFTTATARAAAALLVAGLLALPAVADWLSNDLRSDLTIEPGKQFLLGGEQRGAFRVVAKNKGTVAVVVKERLRDGRVVEKATLKPGQRGVLQFAAGSAAVLLNASSTKANLDLTVTGDTGNLRMATEPLRTTGSASPAPRLTGGELSDALAEWQGTLTYLNYSSPKPSRWP